MGEMVSRFITSIALLVLCVSLVPPVVAQPVVKQPIQVDAGNTKPVGETFGYRITYSCESTSGPCLGAEVIDLLPAEVQYVSTVPASPTGDVAAIQPTVNYMGTGRTRIRFQLINPLPAGNSGDLIINVRFPNGATPDGTQVVNTVDGINLQTTPGTFTSQPVTVTAVAGNQAILSKTLVTSPANLDFSETYRLRISNPNSNGALNLTSIGPVTDTLPPGTVFNGATPAADCQPGCVGTTPATVTWTSPCAVPLQPNQNCDVSVNVTYPSATFPSGTNVTNAFTAAVTPLGESTVTLGPAEVSHPVTTFVANPGATFVKGITSGSPNPPTLNQTFSYDLNVSNSGNVPLDNLVIIDTLPIEFQPISVTTGAYSGLADFAAGEGVRVSYEKNTALGVFTLWGSSPNTTTNTTLTAPPPGLGAGESITRLRWEFGQAQPGMAATTRALITGQIINPDNAGGPVAIGDSIQNCATLSAVYTAGPTNVSLTDCESFNVSGPFVQLNPAKENLSGGGPFNPNQSVSWRLRMRSDARSSDPLPLANIVVTDLLPQNLSFSSWTFDDQGTGLPAPQVFEQIPNFAGTGRTLLRWSWTAGSGNLGVNQQVWINATTTVRSGATSGTLSNDLTIGHDAPGLGQRCTASSQADTLDLDGDGNTAETFCRATGSITVSSIAQIIGSGRVSNICGEPTSQSSASIPVGCAFGLRMDFQNVGTVPFTDLTIIDILPVIGDPMVRSGDPRGSAWTALLVEPVTPPPGTIVYYSTSGNPCRGEVGGPTVGCDAPNWTTTVPSPISSVRSIKIEFGSHVLQPYDSRSVELSLLAPGATTIGTTAYNSFAYQANRADGFGVLAVEPGATALVAIEPTGASIGDLVWIDADGDGTLNDAETGINDVTLRLYSTGADGLARSVDDVHLATTLTTNSPSSEPGWYAFSSLPAGSYYVCVEPLAGTTVNPATVDSTTGCSAAIPLTANEVRSDVDFGLTPTGAGSITGYAWQDQNGDGVQNESVINGLNGVTVELYADNGDATADPATDELVTAAQTTDDQAGQPGYYRFDGVESGAGYFVRFVMPASASGFTIPNAGGNDAVDSDAAISGGATAVVDVLAESSVKFDAGFILATGTLALGDQVWNDTDNDGVYEPQNGETGIDGVRLDLYRDVNSDGAPQGDEFFGTTVTTTTNGFTGRYRFNNLPSGNYIVIFPPSNGVSGGPLAGMFSSLGNTPASDPDDNVDGDDNGEPLVPIVVSKPITLTDNGEPTSEDGNNDTNLTLDFGFSAAAPAPVSFDFGDAPDAGTGEGRGNYRTTLLDDGPRHAISASGPWLGDCVDGDDGTLYNTLATTDDANVGQNATPAGCADDEDGITLPANVIAGMPASLAVTAGGAATCVLTGWIDWNRNGTFGDIPSELVVNAQSIAPGTTDADVHFTVPADAATGETYARFRCASTPMLSPIGAAPDGEVEDYRVTIGVDSSAPATTASATANATDYSFGEWTRFDVTITLEASDADAGVAVTYYAVDNPTCGTAPPAGCLVYTGPFTISAEDEHTVTFFSVDNLGNTEGTQSVAVKIDKTLPALTVPANIVVDPTGPTGTIVSYSATATDLLDPTPQVSCSPPSGTQFTAGTTIVNCTATDLAGNMAIASFTVTVRSVGDLLALLRTRTIERVTHQPTETALVATLDRARQYLNQNNRLLAYAMLVQYAVQIERYQDSGRITPSAARDLLVLAQQVFRVLMWQSLE